MPLMPVAKGKEKRSDREETEQEEPSAQQIQGLFAGVLESEPANAREEKQADRAKGVDKST